MKLTLRTAAAVLATSALLLSQSVFAADAPKEETKPAAALLKAATSPTDPVAKVGKAVITRGELQQAMKAAILTSRLTKAGI